MSKTYVLRRNMDKTTPFLHIILSIKVSVQQQIRFNSTSLGTNVVVLTRFTVPPNMCAQRMRIRAAWVEFLLGAVWIVNGAKCLHTENDDSGQTASISRLICVFLGRMSDGTCSHVSTSILVLQIYLLWKNSVFVNSDIPCIVCVGLYQANHTVDVVHLAIC